MTPLVALRGVEVRHGSRVILSDVTLTIAPGERVAIIGPNGAGKSSLLKVIAGLLPTSAGEAALGGDPIASLARPEIARRVAFMTQDFVPSFSFSALDTVLMGRHPHMAALQTSSETDEQLAREALDAMGIAGLADRDILSLSGGELQRVHFARVVTQAAPLVMLDEPTSAQDFRGARRMNDALSKLAGAGTAVVAVVHDLNLAMRAFPRVVAIGQGGIVADGSPSELLDQEVLQALFGAVEVFRDGDRHMVGVAL